MNGVVHKERRCTENIVENHESVDITHVMSIEFSFIHLRIV